MATKSSSTDTSVESKLIWNGPIDAEEIFETKMSELKTKLIKESIYHCVNEKDSSDRIAARPSLSQLTTPSYATRFAAWEKSIRDLNDDANEAMGTLLSLFHPDCNAHEELTRWFEEDVTATLPAHDKKRVDYKFRNAWTKFYALYQPNKQVNLDTILKKWEALTDENISFADFHGKYLKLIYEMELIGQPPIEAKRYEMLRRNVKNPHLQPFVMNLSLPEARRVSLPQFFEDCTHYIQFNKEKDSNHHKKRKADEIVGRVVTISKDSSESSVPNAICFRCGKPGHVKYNFSSKLACTSTICSLCKSFIGDGNHNARFCSKDSAQAFMRARPDSKKKPASKARKSTSSRGKSSSSKPNSSSSKSVSSNSHGEAAKDLPKEVIAAMAILNEYAKDSGDSHRRNVSFAEDSSSSR